MKQIMEINGYVEIHAPPESVWAALTDPFILTECVSGCDSFERVGPHAFVAMATIKMGPMRSRITVNITFTESDPPRSIVLTMHAKGSLGSAEAVVPLHLHASDGGTSLNYTGHAKLGGQLGRFAKHRGRDAVEELVREFFRRFAAAIPPETTAASEPLPMRVMPRPMPVPQPTMRKRALWIGLGAAAGAAVTAAAALLLTRRRTH